MVTNHLLTGMILQAFTLLKFSHRLEATQIQLMDPASGNVQPAVSGTAVAVGVGGVRVEGHGE